VLAFSLILTLSLTACNNGSTGGKPAPKPNTDPKSLVITNIPAENLADLSSVGTAWLTIITQDEYKSVAGAYLSNTDITIEGSTVTIPLYNSTGNTNTRWTGNGTYNVLIGAGEAILYFADDVVFDKASVTVDYTAFKENLVG
jgi:hypothetical protein